VHVQVCGISVFSPCRLYVTAKCIFSVMDCHSKKSVRLHEYTHTCRVGHFRASAPECTHTRTHIQTSVKCHFRASVRSRTNTSTRTYAHVNTLIHTSYTPVLTHICTYIYIYICMYICVYIYIDRQTYNINRLTCRYSACIDCAKSNFEDGKLICRYNI